MDDLDLVLIMTVNPGFGGQQFIPQSLEKIRILKGMLKARGLDQTLIQVDGGINSHTAEQVRDAGVEVLVAGSAVFTQEDRAAAIASLR